MKRLIVTISGALADKDAIQEANRTASRNYSNQFRVKKAPSPRKHRALSDEEREEKRLRTAQQAQLRDALREAREHELFMRRLKHLTAREAREEERARRFAIHVRYKDGREPKFIAVCPRALFRRTHVEAEKGNNRPTRTASDGKRNIVLKFASCRGFGRKKAGTRMYVAGEAGRIARYICRLEGIEDVEGAVLTNVIAKETLSAKAFSVTAMQRVAGFLNALEEIERATGDAHVYQHLILALPVELGREGRAKALARFCAEFDGLKIPFCAALHKPDPGGDQRNFHAHIVLCARPFEVHADYDWSFSAEKFTELTSKTARPHLRNALADAINHELKEINSLIVYSGVPEAIRVGASGHDTHKGQAVVAKERASQKDAKDAVQMLGHLASHINGLRESIIDSKKRIEKASQQKFQAAAAKQDPKPFPPRKLDDILSFGERNQASDGMPKGMPAAEAVEVEKNGAVPQPVPVVPAEVTPQSAQSPAERPLVEPASLAPEKAYARSRKDIVWQSLTLLGDHMTIHVEALAAALQREPEEVALAIRGGELQIAYRDARLTDSVKAVAESPMMNRWLLDLAGKMKFQHHAVPTTWNHVGITPGYMVFVTRADQWALTHGGVQPADGPAVQYNRPSLSR